MAKEADEVKKQNEEEEEAKLEKEMEAWFDWDNTWSCIEDILESVKYSKR